MASPLEKNTRYIVGLACAGLTIFLGYGVTRADFGAFITVYGLFFALYLRLASHLKDQPETTLRWYIGLGIALRICLLFSLPQLSDDYYRFLWDGRLTMAGIHPFAHPPDYFMAQQTLPPGIDAELFSRLNSPQYFSVYPPVCQAVFALAALPDGQSWWSNVLIMKLFLLVCELGTLWLLSRRNIRDGAAQQYFPALLYALNPLVLLEIMGNCHFEGAMIFFLLAGWQALRRDKIMPAAIWWALATASKLLPLMLLPIVWAWLGARKGLIFIAVFGAASLLLFAPLLAVLPNILESLDLYFRQFQFNASVYYILRGAGFWWKGYDIGETLGPFLGLMTLTGILLLAWRTRDRVALPGGWIGLRPVGFEAAIVVALSLHLFFSATVHPWYITVPFAAGLLGGAHFPLVWTGLAALSYSHYAAGGFEENYWLIALEYGVLWWLVYREYRRYSFPLSPTK